EHESSGAGATLLTSVLADPFGYGRVLRSADGSVSRVVEHKDSSPDELAVNEVATSVYAFDHTLLRDAVTKLSTQNAQGEEYLPDVVGILAEQGHRIAAVVAPADQTAGVNDRVQLASAARVYNDRLLESHMRAGVTVLDPSSAWVDAEVQLAVDVTLGHAVYLHGTTRVDEGATIGPDVSLTDTVVGARSRLNRTVAVSTIIGADVTTGPFAYLRPGTTLADGVHIGAAVEIKNSDIGTGTKIPHLSYVGDASIGAHSNIGAATVFLNYDGVAKHRSTIGDYVKIGGDNMLVAPVEIGDGAYTAAGSVITENVPPGAMGVARAKQRNVAGWVQRKRAGTPAADAATRALAQTDGEN
ncbi:MAG: bifunctional UDP-N-acetylglucosamine diphosphorylase/glucosamine-1-phosphate N-acetyltransferase GlmU, partial [Allobranchiibius sp.]